MFVGVMWVTEPVGNVIVNILPSLKFTDAVDDATLNVFTNPLIEPVTPREPDICASPVNGNAAPPPPNDDVATLVVLPAALPTKTNPSCSDAVRVDCISTEPVIFNPLVKIGDGLLPVLVGIVSHGTQLVVES